MKTLLTKMGSFALCLTLALGGLVGCAQKSDTPDTATSSKEQVLPVTMQAHGNSYTITDFEIQEDEKGNTVIECEVNGFNKLPIKNNQIVIPIYCALISDGTETEFVSFSAKTGYATFSFDAKFNPETIVFYPSDATQNRTEVPV